VRFSVVTYLSLEHENSRSLPIPSLPIKMVQDFALRPDDFVFRGGVLAVKTAQPGILHIRQLPSRLRGMDEKEWSVGNNRLRIYRFNIDPAQDLLVLLEYCSVKCVYVYQVITSSLLTLSKATRAMIWLAIIYIFCH
jgi:hypothetical protein